MSVKDQGMSDGEEERTAWTVVPRGRLSTFFMLGTTRLHRGLTRFVMTLVEMSRSSSSSSIAICSGSVCESVCSSRGIITFISQW